MRLPLVTYCMMMYGVLLEFVFACFHCLQCVCSVCDLMCDVVCNVGVLCEPVCVVALMCVLFVICCVMLYGLFWCFVCVV